MAADVADYSRLMGSDDTAAVQMLSRYRTGLLEEVGRFHGQLFHEAGDGFLVEFENAEDAVLCAVSVQKAVARTNARRRSNAMWFRTGISLGDVIDDGKTKYGNAINIASRVQAIADPGGLCVTSPIFEEVVNKLPYAFDDLGPMHLKNIARPVVVIKVRWAERPPSIMVQPATAAGRLDLDKPTIAVLPFAFIGPHRAKSYMADGLVEEIITELSKYRWLSVVSKNSSFAYKSRKVDARLIAQELGVRYLIEGSLRSDRNKLHIILRLVSGETGEGLWSDRFDRSAREVFELQEDVVMAIASAIEPNVKMAEIQRSRKKPTSSLSAYDHYLQALPHRAALTAEDNEIALSLLEKAIALDPHFSSALAHAAMCYSVRKDQGWGVLTPSETRKALGLARAAIEADFDDPTALYLSGHTQAALGSDIPAGMALIDRSLRINPSSSEAWARSSMVRIYAGDLPTAEQHAENAIRLSPLDEKIFLPLCALGYCYLFSGRYREAIAVARKALVGRQRPPMAYMILLSASHGVADDGGAQQAAQALEEAAPRFRLKAWLAQSCFVRHDQRAVLEAAFRAAGVPG